MSSRAAALASLVAALFAVAACGDDPPDRTADAAAPAAAVEPAPAVVEVAPPVLTATPPAPEPAAIAPPPAPIEIPLPVVATVPPAPEPAPVALPPPAAQPEPPNATAATADPALLARITAGDPASGLLIAARCGSCHTFGAGEGALIGPNLYGIVGATVGRSEGFSYRNVLV